MKQQYKKWLMIIFFVMPCMLFAATKGDASKTRTIGEIFYNLALYVSDIRNLMTIVIVISGFSFVIASFFKFKQVKDNPTQIPIGTPFALLGVGVALVFLPSLIKPAAESLFGDDFKNNSEKCLIPGLSADESKKACDDLKNNKPSKQ